MLVIVQTGQRRRTVRLIGGTWFLGRSAENDIVLEDDTLADVQLNLSHGAEGWRITNLHSAVPIKKNGQLAEVAMVAPGDILLLGSTTLEFAAEDGLTQDRGVPHVGGSTSTILELEVPSHSGEWTRRDRELGLIADLASVIAAGTDTELFLDRTILLIRRCYGARARRGLIATYDEATSEVEVRRSFDAQRSDDDASVARGGDSPHGEARQLVDSFDMSKTILARVLEGRRAVLSTDAATDTRLGTASIVSMGIHSVLAVPILFETRLSGFVYLDSSSNSEPFTRPDLERMALVAGALGALLEGARLASALSRENLALKSRISAESSFITSSREMDALVRDLSRVAATDATVLLIGESGTGKELAAHTLHSHSNRRAGPFVAVNCAAIPDTLIESELFGYAPNSGISGADPAGKPGKFELAAGGTIFLDEIGDMASFTQSKLLRVLQEREVERLAATRPIPIDVRVVSATNKDLVEAVKNSAFREDLYYRLNEIELHIPPLRRRKEEILPLALHFAKTESGREIELAADAREILLNYPWPGNVRELKGCMRTAVILGDGKHIKASDLPDRIRKGKSSLRYAMETLEQVERRHIQTILTELGGNKDAASKALGIARDTLYRKLKKYEIG